MNLLFILLISSLVNDITEKIIGIKLIRTGNNITPIKKIIADMWYGFEVLKPFIITKNNIKNKDNPKIPVSEAIVKSKLGP